MFSQQNLTASPHIMSTDPLAIPVKKGEKFLRFMQLLRGSTFEGEQSKTVFILFTLFMFMVIVLCFG